MTDVAAAFRAGGQTYRALGSPLYATLCAKGADDAEIVELAGHAQAGSQPVFHVLASVHYLLLKNPDDPLSKYFATLTDDPAPAENAFPAFARYCRTHRAEIMDLLKTRTVQTTYVERCASIVPPLSVVADEAGEPLNLIEIGCSAGVLLTFDKYAYDFKDRARVGSADAPLTLPGNLRGGPALRIPKIGKRVGLDLHPVDVRSAEERRWLIALSFPEFRDQRARLSTALDIVAQTDIRMFEGDALKTLPGVLADMPSPLCIFHSACLYYWSAEAKAALDMLLAEASRERDIYRVGVEASAQFNAFHKEGRGDASKMPGGEMVIARYRKGAFESRVVARTSAATGVIDWAD